ncbi:MAG TPA: hypothetical protein VF528_13775 [Pyrinomonadaceae bacterium]
MATKLSGKKLDGKRLGFIAIVFAILFSASSLQVYRSERTATITKEMAAKLLAELPQTTRDAAEVEILHLSSCNTALNNDIADRTARVANDYETAIKNLASEVEFSPDGRIIVAGRTAEDTSSSQSKLKSVAYGAAFDPKGHCVAYPFISNHILSTKKERRGSRAMGNWHITFRYPGYTVAFSPAGKTPASFTERTIKVWDLEGNGKPSLTAYFYQRLALELWQTEGHLSASDYRNEKFQLAKAYFALAYSYTGRTASKAASDEQAFNAKLAAAEQQNIHLQAQNELLKEQIARATRSWAEKWIPLFVAIFSVLMAVSSNILAVRSDRRQAREARLLPLKQRDLEHTVTQKAQQLGDRDGKIIIPTPDELQLYSRTVPVNNFHWGKRPRL